MNLFCSLVNVEYIDVGIVINGINCYIIFDESFFELFFVISLFWFVEVECMYVFGYFKSNYYFVEFVWNYLICIFLVFMLFY